MKPRLSAVDSESARGSVAESLDRFNEAAVLQRGQPRCLDTVRRVFRCSNDTAVLQRGQRANHWLPT
jgi:hypothetical protein